MEQKPAKQAKLVDKSAVVTVKWKKKHGQLAEAKLRSTFDGFGEIEALLVKEDKAVMVKLLLKHKADIFAEDNVSADKVHAPYH